MTSRPAICLLHPGAMGSAFGAIAHGAGHRVTWVAAGRSDATRARAAAAGLEAADSLAAALASADIVLSICPPHAALDVAREVAAQGFRGLYCDANAVSPDTVRAVDEVVRAAGAQFVDGGIIGSPPRGASTLRLCLAGPQATRIAAMFEGTAIEPLLLDSPIGAASAMKICYAAWSKGSLALLQAICAVARHEDVLDPLMAEWQRSQPELQRRFAQIPDAAGKAWRWQGEMEEVAQLFEASGLPPGFHRAAAQVFGRLAGFKDRAGSSLDDVVAVLGQAH